MDDADAVRDELDRLFTGQLAEATAAAAVAKRRLDEWQRGGIFSQDEVIEAWKKAAARALATAETGADPHAEIERVEAIRRSALEHGYWPADDDLPAEVEVALRKALRVARR